MTGQVAGAGRVLVTGAGGMSGLAITDRLLAAGWTVTALAAPWSMGRLAGRPAPTEALSVVPCDLADGIPEVGPLDMIVHAAARSPGPRVGAREMVRANVQGALSLAARAAVGDVRTVINFSSLSVYGTVAVHEVDEATPRVDPDVYGQTKWLAETILAEGAGSHRVLSLRLPGILGPDAGRNWLSRVWAAARRGATISIVNPNGAFNNAVHVDDLAALIAALPLREWSGRDAVTLGAAGMTTIRGAVERLVDAAGGRSRIEVGSAARPGFTISSRRAVERYGYQPQDIDAMLERYIAENAVKAL